MRPQHLDPCSTAGDDEAHDLWGLVFEAARLDEVVEQAVRTLELSSGEVRVRARAGVQRLLSQVLDTQRRARGRAASGGRPRWRTTARNSRAHWT